MLQSLTALCLIICGFVAKDPLYYIAAGTFEIAGVIHSCLTARVRLK
jgi:hypothetical protein